MNRRDFFRKTALGASSAALLGANLRAADTETAKTQEGPIVTRMLGRTGITVPVVSMGVMNADNPELLRQSYKAGVRHFDTAWYYQRGNNEKMVGRVLKELQPKREEVTIATKIFLSDNPKSVPQGAAARDLFLRRFDESLSRLQLDYVDILYYHAIQTKEQVLDPNVLEALSLLKQQKKIRFAGISTHVYWPEILRCAADEGFYDVALLSYNYSMDGDAKLIAALRHAREKGLGLVAMKTQCQQDWYRRSVPGEMQKFYEGKIMHSALLKWVMRHEEFATAVPGYTTFQQLEEDFAVARNLAYSAEERQFLEDRNIKVALASSCQICGRCTGTCPKGVDIPDLMRTHMYAFSYGNPHKARETLAEIEEGRGLKTCTECGSCVAQCARSVAIAARIDELKATYA